MKKEEKGGIVQQTRKQTTPEELKIEVRSLCMSLKHSKDTTFLNSCPDCQQIRAETLIRGYNVCESSGTFPRSTKQLGSAETISVVPG